MRAPLVYGITLFAAASVALGAAGEIPPAGLTDSAAAPNTAATATVAPPKTEPQVAEYVNFKGRLREKGTRAPVADAMVVLEILDTSADTGLGMRFGAYLQAIGGLPGQTLEEGKLTTTTDSLGYFAFRSVPAGPIKVTFPIRGYRRTEFKETLVHGERLEMDYRIPQEGYDGYEIVVYGKGEKVEVAKTALSASEIRRVPGFGGDAVKVVEALPGVARPSFVSGEVLIRGSGPEDSRFLLDGVTVFRLFHFGAWKSIYNSELLSSIDMYPGGFGARYGAAVGGIVEVKGRPARTDRWHAKTDVNVVDASVMAEGPLGAGFSLQGSATYSYLGDIIKAATHDLTTTVAPLYRDGYARLDWDLGPRDKLFLTWSGSRDDLEIIAPDVRGGSDELTGNTSTAKTGDAFQMALLGWNGRFGEHFSHELRISGIESNSSGSLFGAAKFGARSRGFGLREEIKYAPAPWFSLTPGLDANFERFHFHYDFTTDNGLAQGSDALPIGNLGAYASAEIRPMPRWLVVPGVRYDYYSEVDEGLPAYRLASRLEYAPGLTLKASAGTYSQAPKFAGITVKGLGNPDLPPVEAQHFTFGHEWRITDLVTLDAQTYFNRQTHMPNATDSIDPTTSGAVNFLPDMEGRMYGLELLLRHDRGQRFFGWIAYTLSRSERRAPHPFAAELYAGDQAWDPDAWVLAEKDQTHNLQVVGSWRLPRSWEAGFRFRYVTGNPATPLKSMASDRFSYDSDARAYVAEPGRPFSDRVGPFVQLDLRVDKKFAYRNWILSTYFDVSNANYFVYNSPETYAYNYDNSRRKAIGALFLPSLGFTTEF